MLTYEEGYRNGHLDRLIGITSTIALTCPHREYQRGYQDGLSGIEPRP
jgi:hypothetical protein